MINLFRKKPITPSDAARALRQQGIEHERAMCDQMNRDMRREPKQWPEGRS